MTPSSGPLALTCPTPPPPPPPPPPCGWLAQGAPPRGILGLVLGQYSGLIGASLRGSLGLLLEPPWALAALAPSHGAAGAPWAARGAAPGARPLLRHFVSKISPHLSSGRASAAQEAPRAKVSSEDLHAGGLGTTIYSADPRAGDLPGPPDRPRQPKMDSKTAQDGFHTAEKTPPRLPGARGAEWV